MCELSKATRWTTKRGFLTCSVVGRMPHMKVSCEPTDIEMVMVGPWCFTCVEELDWENGISYSGSKGGSNHAFVILPNNLDLSITLFKGSVFSWHQIDACLVPVRLAHLQYPCALTIPEISSKNFCRQSSNCSLESFPVSVETFCLTSPIRCHKESAHPLVSATGPLFFVSTLFCT